MRLIQSVASPFARKARVVVIETGLQSRVTEVDSGAVTPVSNNVSVNAINPLGMIPAMELENGDCIFDSCVICEYLNRAGNGQLFPGDPKAYLNSRKLESLADGIMDLSVALRYETALRPENLRWQEFIDHSNEKINRGLDTLEALTDTFSQQITIGEIAVACALGYRDFRYRDMNWREDRSALKDWFAQFSERPSMLETKPEP